MKNEETEKMCRTCQEVVPIEDFYTSGTLQMKFFSSCKACCNRQKDLYIKDNPEKAKLKDVRRQENKKRNYTKEELSLQWRISGLKRKYNMTLEDYDDMYIKQEGKCKICMDFYPKLHIDHCHDSNKVRGLLCNECNTGIGFLQENTLILERAIQYLKESNTDKRK